MSTSFDFLNKHFFERKSCSFSDNHQKEKCLFNSIDRVLEREMAELLAQRFFFLLSLEVLKSPRVLRSLREGTPDTELR